MRDLAFEFQRLGHRVTVFYPDPEITENFCFKEEGGIGVLRLRTGQTRDITYIKRTFNELLMPYLMWRHFKKSPYYNYIFDGVVWYSPSIFFEPLVRRLKQKSQCKGYLILRDIFPEWALDLGLLKQGVLYKFFKQVAIAQYEVADVIGVQTEGNLGFMSKWNNAGKRKVEVLHNWLAPATNIGCSISIAQTSFSDRKIFVYAGNMGIGQGMDILLDLASSLTYRSDIGFLLVGRGSDLERLRSEVIRKKLDNVLFFDEIPPEEVMGLFQQCNIGLVMLDQRHKTHNIPGKFLTYMQSGLPALAIVNPENDLIDLINDEKVGLAIGDYSVDTIRDQALKLLELTEIDTDFAVRCMSLAEKMFSSEVAAKQIIDGFTAVP